MRYFGRGMLPWMVKGVLGSLRIEMCAEEIEQMEYLIYVGRITVQVQRYLGNLVDN